MANCRALSFAGITSCMGMDEIIVTAMAVIAAVMAIGVTAVMVIRMI
jgi:hypothetical protein